MKIYLLNPITTNFTSFKTFLEFGQKKPYFGQVILSSLISLNWSIRIGNFFCLIRVCYCNVNFLLEHMNLVQAHQILSRLEHLRNKNIVFNKRVVINRAHQFLNWGDRATVLNFLLTVHMEIIILCSKIIKTVLKK